ncbi:hypothetical protein [Staphylococcus phage VB-SauS-SA2]|nr:hypothetical protein [Staphylococcus phage VB-SauS-SA2]
MTNFKNELKTMETEAEGVRNDVINFLLEDVDNYSPQDKLQDLLQHGCESGMVNHLIYTKDTVEYFEDHESEIMEMLENFGITDVESWEGIQELSDMFPQLDNADDRHENAENEIMEKAENETPELYGDDWDEMGGEEQIDAIQEYASNIMMYDNNPMELTDIDKNCLTWAIFEYNASVLFDELDEMQLIK